MQGNKKAYSLIGWSLFVILVLSALLNGISDFVSIVLGEGLLSQIVLGGGVTIGTFLVIIPVVAYMLRKLPAKKEEGTKSASSPNLVLSLLIIGLGSIVLVGLLRIAVMGFQQNVIILPREFSWITLFSCIGAAIAEEIIFRKILLDYLRPYGNKEAIMISAMAFALCHMNVWSALFTFVCGLLWGKIVIDTGKIRYSCLLHVTNNILIVSLLPFIFTKMTAGLSNLISVALIAGGLAACVIKRKYIATIFEEGTEVGILNMIKSPGMTFFFIFSVCVNVFFFILQF